MTIKRTKVTANEDDWWKRKDTDWQRTTFGVNTSGIAKMKNGIWVKDKFVSNEKLEMIIELHAKGVSLRHTSAEVGVSVGRIRHIFDKIIKGDLKE